MSERRARRGFPASRPGGFVLLPVVLALSLVAAVAFLLNRTGGMNMYMAAGGLEADSARYVAEAGLAQINTQTQGRNCTGYTDLATTPFGPHGFTATVNPKAGSPVTLVATAATAGGAAATLTRSNVPVYPTTPPAVATLQAANAATGTDAWLNWTKPTRNYGAAAVLLVQSSVGSALLQFNLSSIPAGSRISGATLQLSKSNSGTDTGTIAVYRLTRAWVEGTDNDTASTTGVTYGTSNGTTAWTTPGGDYDPLAVASLTGIVAGWNSWNVTSLVQGWSAGTYPNYGLIVVPTAAGTVGANFVGSDWAGNEPLFPKLVVTYTAPC